MSTVNETAPHQAWSLRITEAAQQHAMNLGATEDDVEFVLDDPESRIEHSDDRVWHIGRDLAVLLAPDDKVIAVVDPTVWSVNILPQAQRRAEELDITERDVTAALNSPLHKHAINKGRVWHIGEKASILAAPNRLVLAVVDGGGTLWGVPILLEAQACANELGFTEEDVKNTLANPLRKKPARGEREWVVGEKLGLLVASNGMILSVREAALVPWDIRILTEAQTHATNLGFTEEDVKNTLANPLRKKPAGDGREWVVGEKLAALVSPNRVLSVVEAWVVPWSSESTPKARKQAHSLGAVEADIREIVESPLRKQPQSGAIWHIGETLAALVSSRGIVTITEASAVPWTLKATTKAREQAQALGATQSEIETILYSPNRELSGLGGFTLRFGEKLAVLVSPKERALSVMDARAALWNIQILPEAQIQAMTSYGLTEEDIKKLVERPSRKAPSLNGCVWHLGEHASALVSPESMVVAVNQTMELHDGLLITSSARAHASAFGIDIYDIRKILDSPDRWAVDNKGRNWCVGNNIALLVATDGVVLTVHDADQKDLLLAE